MSDDSKHIYADEGLRALILAQTDLALGPLTPAQVGEFPGDGLLADIDGYAYVAIEVVDGNGDRFASEPVIDVDVFATKRSVAKSVAAAIALLILRYPETVAVAGGHFTIDEASCTRFPVKLPWDDTEIKRQSATYQLSVRR